MSWIAVAIGGSAIAGGTAGYFGAKSSNKKLAGLGLGDPLPSFSGQRPAIPGRLREVETQIDDILLRRSAGQDVGFDPARRQALQEASDIRFGQRSRREEADIGNFLSGAGLSRNVAAREALLGRARTDTREQQRLSELGFDIEDLERRNVERDINTARLQQQSGAKFGQQATRSNFDFNVTQQAINSELARRGLQVQGFQQFQSPLGSAVSGAASGASIGASVAGLGQSPSSASLGQLGQSPTGRNISGELTMAGFQTPAQQAQAKLLQQRGLNLIN